MSGNARFRFDSEYVWEGDQMFEDIVASTEPNLYMQPHPKYCSKYQDYQTPTPNFDDLDLDDEQMAFDEG